MTNFNPRPKPGYRGNQQNARYPLPDDFPAETVCLTIRIPKSFQWYQIVWDTLFSLGRWTAYQYDKDRTATAYAGQFRELLFEAKTAMPRWNSDSSLFCAGRGGAEANEGGTGGFSGGYSFDDLLEIMTELDMKFSINGKLYEPAIPLVECGCGAGAGDDDEIPLGGGAQNQPSNVPGATGGGGYGEFTTLCDALTVLPGYITNSVDDVMDRLATGALLGEIGSTIVGGGATIGQLADAIRDSTAEIQSTLTDVDFQNLLEDKILRYFADPWKSPPTRRDLRGFAYQIPFFFEGAPMWSAFVLWAEFVDIEALDKAVTDAAGAGNESECAGKFAAIGRTPFVPSSSGTTGEHTLNITTGGAEFVAHIYGTPVPFEARSGGGAFSYDTVPASALPVGGGTWFTDGAVTGGTAPGLGIRLGGDGNWLVSGVSMVGITEYLLDGYDTTEMTAGQYADVAAAVRGFLNHPTPNVTDTTVVASVDNVNPRGLYSGSGSSFTGSATIAASWWIEKL